MGLSETERGGDTGLYRPGGTEGEIYIAREENRSTTRVILYWSKIVERKMGVWRLRRKGRRGEEEEGRNESRVE
jgi:hypothetical protein